jgi:circadian clock protein KaiB
MSASKPKIEGSSEPMLVSGGRGAPILELRLYVAGQTPRSMAAFANLRRICEEHLVGRYKLEVIDLMKNPTLARGDQILAVPTLVKKLPTPVRKILGDLSNTERVLVDLDLQPARTVSLGLTSPETSSQR